MSDDEETLLDLTRHPDARERRRALLRGLSDLECPFFVLSAVNRIPGGILRPRRRGGTRRRRSVSPSSAWLARLPGRILGTCRTA
jgi:hypothetical protein